MNTSKVVYHKELRTEAKHLRSGVVIHTDAPVDNNGKGACFSPTDLLATSLATCLLTIMGIVAEREGWNMEGTEATVVKEMFSTPRRVGRIAINLTMPGGIPVEARKKLELAARTCPVAKSLNAGLQQEINFYWQ